MLLWSHNAHASGISVARFGGEHGHPTTSNATAIYYNPAGLALSKGTHIFLDGTLALRWASYDRPAIGPDDATLGTYPVQSSQQTLQLAPGANDGRASLFNTVALPFAGVTSDFGTDFIAAGIAVYFPFGGTAVWDENEQYANNQQFPGAVDGVQRWYSIDGTIQSMYITAAVAYRIKKIGLSIGVSGSAIRSEINTIRARNPDGSDDLVTTDANGNMIIKEGRSALDVSGWQGGFGVGLLYDVLNRGKYFIGVSYTSQPNVAGGMRLEGTLDNAFGLGIPSRSDAALLQSMPDILRLGVRIRPTDRYEIRAFADYTRWSVFDKQCIVEQSFEGDCSFVGEDNALDLPETFGSAADFNGSPEQLLQHLPRYWRDSGGVRVGASYWFIPQVEGYFGLGYDSNAIPAETLDPALIDTHKMSISAGVRWQVIKHLALSLTSTEIVYFKRDTKGKSTLSRFEAPTRQASGDGVYRQFLQTFNLYGDISF